MDTSIVDRVIEQLKDLPQELQWRVLEFTRAVSSLYPSWNFWRGITSVCRKHFER